MSFLVSPSPAVVGRPSKLACGLLGIDALQLFLAVSRSGHENAPGHQRRFKLCASLVHLLADLATYIHKRAKTLIDWEGNRFDEIRSTAGLQYHVRLLHVSRTRR